VRYRKGCTRSPAVRSAFLPREPWLPSTASRSAVSSSTPRGTDRNSVPADYAIGDPRVIAADFAMSFDFGCIMRGIAVCCAPPRPFLCETSSQFHRSARTQWLASRSAAAPLAVIPSSAANPCTRPRRHHRLSLQSRRNSRSPTVQSWYCPTYRGYVQLRLREVALATAVPDRIVPRDLTVSSDSTTSASTSCPFGRIKISGG
jgi:hypothetical protein